jgi:hypothetical protein
LDFRPIKRISPILSEALVLAFLLWMTGVSFDHVFIVGFSSADFGSLFYPHFFFELP